MKRVCWCLSLRVGCTIISFLALFLGFLHLAEYFRLKAYHDPAQGTVWLNLLWGILHLLAGMCLSFSVLTGAVIPIMAYTLIETFFLIYTITYASVSCALKTNIYANLGLEYGIAYWIFVVLACGLTVYFLYTAISFYFLRRQQRKGQEEFNT